MEEGYIAFIAFVAANVYAWYRSKYGAEDEEMLQMRREWKLEKQKKEVEESDRLYRERQKKNPS